jgi:hypothetical protein
MLTCRFFLPRVSPPAAQAQVAAVFALLRRLINSDEKESEKVVYVIVAICLLGFVQEHLGGGVAEEDADESPSHSFAEEDEEVRFFFHAYCSCN